MTKKHIHKTIINRKICICKNKLNKNINFGNLPLINNYIAKKNFKKYPVVISQCKKLFIAKFNYC